MVVQHQQQQCRSVLCTYTIDSKECVHSFLQECQWVCVWAVFWVFLKLWFATALTFLVSQPAVARLRVSATATVVATAVASQYVCKWSEEEEEEVGAFAAVYHEQKQSQQQQHQRPNTMKRILAQRNICCVLAFAKHHATMTMKGKKRKKFREREIDAC